MTTYLLYGGTIFLFVISFVKDKEKTKIALKKGWKSFENVMPQFLGLIFIIGLMLAVLKPEVISSLIGNKSGILGVIASAIVGSITMMPTFVAFPAADMLLKSGAGYAQIAALVSTLTMVGVLTFTLETKYIGKRAALYRNLLAFFFAFVVAFIIGKTMGVGI